MYKSALSEFASVEMREQESFIEMVDVEEDMAVISEDSQFLAIISPRSRFTSPK